jgi:hypothetical protein
VEAQGSSGAAVPSALEFVSAVEPVAYSSAWTWLWFSAVAPESALPN